MSSIEILEQTSLPRVLLFLLKNNNANISLLKSEIAASQASIYKAIVMLKNDGLVTDKKSKKPPFERIVTISEKGKTVAKKLQELYDMFEQLNKSQT